MLTDNLPLAAYLAIGLCGGAMISLWIHLFLRHTESRRKKQLNQKELGYQLTDTDPNQQTAQESYEAAIENIKMRFRLIRKILIPTAWMLWLFVFFTPLLSYLPSGYTSFVLGTFTVIIGIAAQPFLENVIAGIVVSVGQPFRVRDTVVIDGEYGTVELIALTYTVIKRWDWVRYVIPNSILFKKEFLNYTLVDNYRLTHVEFWVAPHADLDLVRMKAIESVKSSDNFSPYEEPSFWVMELGKEGIKCWVAGWTTSPLRSWALTHDVRTQLALYLREEGINFHEHIHTIHSTSHLTSANST